MPFELQYTGHALEDLKRLRAYDQATIIGQIEAVLAVNPTLAGRSRVKLLRQPAPSQYRLRVGSFRIFYDVDGNVVRILRVLSKELAPPYLEGMT